MTTSFPPHFLWGSATAAYQVEGQNFNCDWWDWEQTPGHVRNGDSARVACDWWNGRWREDFDRAQAMGHNAHRMSVEWSRIEPLLGEWDDRSLQVYRDMLIGLRERGIEPMVTLVHFTHPLWFLAKTGWQDEKSPEWVERYTTHVVEYLGDLCKYWITLNEPNLYVLLSYVWKLRPPGAGSLPQALQVTRNLMRAHHRMYAAIHRAQPDAQVSLAHQWRWISPANPASMLDRAAAGLGSYVTNDLFVRALTDGVFAFPLGFGQKFANGNAPLDYIALNYYFQDRIEFDLSRPGSLFARNIRPAWIANTPFAYLENAGSINPDAFYQVLKHFAQYKLPIIVTENGMFDIGGDAQARYLISHLAALQRAQHAGVDVRGYLWWTLSDNFEWDEGHALRFGLYQMDVTTQARVKRPVADVYAQIIRENGISDDLFRHYGSEK